MVNLGLQAGMILTSLLLCADPDAVAILSRILEELGLRVEVCPDAVRAAVRLAQERFDLIILDCEKQSDVVHLLQECRSSRANEKSLAVVVVEGQESIREMFELGVNFVLYKPVSQERALSTLRAAFAVLHRDKRRKARATVHTHATIDYAGVEQAKATLVDLAEDGMAVSFGRTLPPTCKVYFQFQLPGQTATVRLSGQLVWQDWNGHAGIQFADVPKASRRVLTEWLQSNLAAASQAPAAEAVEVEQGVEPRENPIVVERLGVDRNWAANKFAGKPKLKPEEKREVKRDVTPAVTQEEKQEAKQRDRDAVARLHSNPDNRRGQTRYACRLGAEVYQQGSLVRSYCHLSDLSPGGCYLEMPLAFAAGCDRDRGPHPGAEVTLDWRSEAFASRLRDGYFLSSEYQRSTPGSAAVDRLRCRRGREQLEQFSAFSSQPYLRKKHRVLLSIVPQMTSCSFSGNGYRY